MLGETRRVRITGIDQILGSITANEEIFTKYIASKCETDEELSKAEEDAKKVAEMEGKETIFYRDSEGNPVLKGYQIKGFLKSAAKALRGTFDVMGSGTTSQGKIDTLIFINQDDINFYKDGKKVTDIDGYLERPLRAMTAQGPRVSLAKSEVINSGWTAEFDVTFISDVSGGRAKTYTWDTIEKMFEYGSLNGLLQWRNSGKGRFTTEWIS